MFTMIIGVNSGKNQFKAKFANTTECAEAVFMVQSGAQVSEAVCVSIEHDDTGTTIEYISETCRGMYTAVRDILNVLISVVTVSSDE